MATTISGKKRKPGRPKKVGTTATTKKVGASKKTTKVGAASTRTFGGKAYSFVSCFDTTRQASQAACSLRADGKRARVVDSCVYSRSR